MSSKIIPRPAVDGFMILFILPAMADKLTENRIHETIGVLFLFLVIIHDVLNRRWYKTLRQGRYGTRRILNLGINILLLTAMVILFGSSIMTSRMLFAFPDIKSNLTVRQIHTTAAYWFLILMAVHIGAQWTRLGRMLKKMIPVLPEGLLYIYVMWLVQIAIVALGMAASFDRGIGSRLFMVYAFDFWDFDRSVLGFFARYLAVMGAYAVVTHNIFKFDPYKKSAITNVNVVIGSGLIGQAIARRVSTGRRVLLADLRRENADAAAKILSDSGFEVSTAIVDVASRKSVHALVETAMAIGPIIGVIHAAGVSPTQASPDTILKVDLYGTALVLEEFGNVIARGGAGVVIASLSGHRLPALTPEQDKALATTPADDLLTLPMLRPGQVTDPLHAYQVSKRGNALRVRNSG